MSKKSPEKRNQVDLLFHQLRKKKIPRNETSLVEMRDKYIE